MPRADQHWATGDYFSLKLKQGYGFGRVVGRSLIAVYEFKSDGHVALAELDAAPILFYCHIMESAATSRYWHTIGSAPLEMRLAEPIKFALYTPRSRVRGIWIANHREFISVDSDEVLVGMEWSRLYDVAMVKQRLQNHFSGRECPIKSASIVTRTWREAIEQAQEPTDPLSDILESDSVADWSAELVAKQRVDQVGAAFDAVVAEADYLQGPDAATAIAAAAVVAAASGGPASKLPRQLTRWIARNRTRMDLAKLRPRALLALERIGAARSELVEQWAEAGMEAEGRKLLRELADRLQ